MLVIAWRGEQSGLFPAVAGTTGISRESLVVTDTVVLWLVVIVTSVAGSINERELRRRRYDAEALANLLGRAGFVRVHPAGRDAAIDPGSREAGAIRLVGIKP
jgi:hypothetical protein